MLFLFSLAALDSSKAIPPLKSADRAVVLCFHNVDGPGEYALTLAQLTRVFDLLKDRYDVMSLADWRKRHEKAVEGRPIVVLTFDDGYPSLLKTVVPLLQQYNFGATFYIYTQRHDDDSEFYKKIAKLPAEFEIGSHSLTHSLLTQLSPEEFFRELYHSRLKLSFLLGRSIDNFAWPYGAYNPEFVELAKQVGYTTQVSVVSRVATVDDLNAIVPRFTVTRQKPIERVKKILRSYEAP